MPVGLPVAAELIALPPHWMPMSRVKVVSASTMRASIEHLRRLGIEVAHEVLGERDVARHVGDDERGWCARRPTTLPRGDSSSCTRGSICAPSA